MPGTYALTAIGAGGISDSYRGAAVDAYTWKFYSSSGGSGAFLSGNISIYDAYEHSGFGELSIVVTNHQRYSVSNSLPGPGNATKILGTGISVIVGNGYATSIEDNEYGVVMLGGAGGIISSNVGIYNETKDEVIGNQSIFNIITSDNSYPAIAMVKTEKQKIGNKFYGCGCGVMNNGISCDHAVDESGRELLSYGFLHLVRISD